MIEISLLQLDLFEVSNYRNLKLFGNFSYKMTSIFDLPREIMLKIFQMYLETESQQNLMNIVYNVSADWANLCFDSSLWINFDGTVPFMKMMMLCKAGSFRNTKQFTFCNVKNLEDSEIILFSELKKVNSINFSKLEKINKSILPALAKNCHNLHDIHFAKFNVNYSKRVNYDSLVSFFSVRGSNLISINLSYCTIQRLSVALRCIADCCHNLEYLNLIHLSCAYAVFPTKYFQEKCAKLKELHLDYKFSFRKEICTKGFPDLEVFTFGNPRSTAINDEELNCILFNSHKLKVLDLTNSDISPNIICSLPATNIQSLLMSKTKICNSNNLSEVLRKWCLSLKEVDISYSSNSSINEAIMNLVSTYNECQIEELNLSFTPVTANVVATILQNCNKLYHLRLEACRNLDRGMKRIYYGKSELNMLSEKLKSF